MSKKVPVGDMGEKQNKMDLLNSLKDTASALGISEGKYVSEGIDRRTAALAYRVNKKLATGVQPRVVMVGPETSLPIQSKSRGAKQVYEGDFDSETYTTRTRSQAPSSFNTNEPNNNNKAPVRTPRKPPRKNSQ
ncbi:hypothetical protein Pelo_9393 [Pelomyxa schiedti]|nr:hypothetical protein Pelo_9393 [Pelomyxa schiedti]